MLPSEDMALCLSRAFGAMGAEVARFDRRKAVVDPELGLMSAEDMQMANFMLPGPNMVGCAPRRTAWCASTPAVPPVR